MQIQNADGGIIEVMLGSRWPDKIPPSLERTTTGAACCVSCGRITWAYKDEFVCSYSNQHAA